ncbi:MAG: hypothetical protein Q7T55_07765 [Solirubrobacteraceae bacterium]|nr:hypothetical protein [Solirubrobacteraceae bacterium]
MSFAAGQLHSVLWHGDGTYNVAKVLVADDRGLHVRVYAEQFFDRPTTLPTDLEVGSPYDGTVFGVSHIPVTVEQYEAWSPELLGQEPVTEDDLDGYRQWLAAAADTDYLGEVEEGGLIGRLASRFKKA